MCQINTETMKQELGCIDVNVPPDIDMAQTSNDVTVQVRVSHGQFYRRAVQDKKQDYIFTINANMDIV